jgi:hypothetical protein
VASERVLKNTLLYLPELLRGHTGSKVALIVLNQIQNFKIFGKIGCITSDNASANDIAMSALLKHISERDPIQYRTHRLGYYINLVA